jgi:hypothetical protein
MDQTMAQLNTSMGAVDLVRDVSHQVSSFLGNYGWQEKEKNAESR